LRYQQLDIVERFSGVEVHIGSWKYERRGWR